MAYGSVHESCTYGQIVTGQIFPNGGSFYGMPCFLHNQEKKMTNNISALSEKTRLASYLLIHKNKSR
jgi:hypothetical protein